MIAPVRRLLVAALALGVPASALAESAAPPSASDRASADVLMTVKGRLRTFETLQGTFEQEKRLLKIKKPLKSRGRFALRRGRGVLWRTEAPIRSLLAMTRDEVRVIKDDRTTMSISLSEQPGIRLMGEIVFAVFAADVETIRRRFEVLSAETKPDAPWRIVLKPRDAAVGKLVQSLSLVGGAHVDAIEITEKNGDTTSIRFAAHDAVRPLDREDARVLGANGENTRAQ